MKSINRIVTNRQCLFLVLAFIIFCFYFPARNALFIDDGSMGLMEIKSKGLAGYWNAYDAENLYYGQYALQIILYKLFGTKATLWLLFFSLMHSLNTLLLYRFLQKLHVAFNLQQNYGAHLASCFFFFSPYNSETIAWAATTHYCTSMAFLLWSSYLVLDFVSGGYSVKDKIIFYLLFAIALTTLEFAFLFPLFYLAIYFTLPTAKISFKKFIANIIFPTAACVITYLIVLKIFKHNDIPRMGKIEDISFVNPLQIANRFMQAIAKVWGQVHFIDCRVKIYEFLSAKYYGAILLCTIIVSIFSFLFYKKRKWMPLFILFAFGVFIFLYPLLRIHFSYYFRHEHARYMYFGGLFLYIILAYLIAFLSGKFLHICAAFFACIFANNLMETIREKQMAASLFTTYQEQYPIIPSGKNYILNAPAFCAQSPLFLYDTRMPDAYYVLHDKYIKDQYREIMSVAYANNMDSFVVEKKDSLTYYLKLIEPGTWYIKDGYGAKSYTTPEYTCTLDAYGGMTVHFSIFGINDKVFYYIREKFVQL